MLCDTLSIVDGCVDGVLVHDWEVGGVNEVAVHDWVDGGVPLCPMCPEITKLIIKREKN